MNQAAITKTYPKTLIGRLFVQEKMNNFYKKINSAKPVIDTNIRKDFLDTSSDRFIQIQTMCEKLYSGQSGLEHKHNCVTEEILTFKPNILPSSVESKLLKSDHYQTAMKKRSKRVIIDSLTMKTVVKVMEVKQVEIFDDAAVCLNNLFNLCEEVNEMKKVVEAPEKDKSQDKQISAENEIFISRQKNYGVTICYSKHEQMRENKKEAHKTQRYKGNYSSKTILKSRTDPRRLTITRLPSYQFSSDSNCDEFSSDDTTGTNESSVSVDGSFHFFKDVTEDILQSGIRSDSHLKKVIEKHVKGNKYNLDSRTLKKKTDSLKLTFGIPLDESDRWSTSTYTIKDGDVDETINAMDHLNIPNELQNDILRSLGLDSTCLDGMKKRKTPKGKFGIGVNGLLETLNDIEERFCNQSKM